MWSYQHHRVICRVLLHSCITDETSKQAVALLVITSSLSEIKYHTWLYNVQGIKGTVLYNNKTVLDDELACFGVWLYCDFRGV